jgi:hypothetical protein
VERLSERFLKKEGFSEKHGTTKSLSVTVEAAQPVTDPAGSKFEPSIWPSDLVGSAESLAILTVRTFDRAWSPSSRRFVDVQASNRRLTACSFQGNTWRQEKAFQVAAGEVMRQSIQQAMAACLLARKTSTNVSIPYHTRENL